jgi:Holliday junction resolvase RusA-like endonuclease
MTFTVRIPVPPSTNALFVTFRDRGGIRRAKTKEYLSWIKAAGLMLNVQRPVPVRGKVKLAITVARNNRRDLSNHIKAIEDLLVGMSLIDDDRHVEEILMMWDDISDALVTVKPA